MPVILASSHLRVDVGGTPAIDGLTFTSTGDHILVLGAARALFEAAAGLRAIARGELLVEGLAAIEAVRSGIVASAPLDPPMPGTWSVVQYTVWSARLSGHARSAALAMAADALEQLQISSMSTTKLGRVPLAVRRATVLAAALATGAKTLLVENPVAHLADDAARPLGKTIMRVLSGRRAAIFAPRVPLESPLALAADEAIVVDGSDIAAQGAPAEIASRERTLALRVHGDLAAFTRAVEARGGRAEAAVSGASPALVRVDLGPLAARDLLGIAAESDAVVVELRPLARSFA
jgi:ABC-2 type transport system ATP-binding protein